MKIGVDTLGRVTYIYKHRGSEPRQLENKMETLLKEYHDTRLAVYNTKMDNRGAQIAAKFALDDKLVTIRQQKECGYSLDNIKNIILMDIEDLNSVLNRKV